MKEYPEFEVFTINGGNLFNTCPELSGGLRGEIDFKTKLYKSYKKKKCYIVVRHTSSVEFKSINQYLQFINDEMSRFHRKVREARRIRINKLMIEHNVVLID